MKIKIVSDGMPRNTKVVSVETGEMVDDVNCIDWHITVDGYATATLGFCQIPVDVVAEAPDGFAEQMLPWRKPL